jgi:hypothetical protein
MRASSSRFLMVAVLFLGAALDANAQTPPPSPAAAPAAAPAETPSAPLLKAEELDQLVAPIALYPDALLANVLMAATYPLEVVQADRWAKANKSLKGEKLKAEVDKQQWDDSVKQLTATPSVLDMMGGKLDWTQKLGDTMLAQQADLMDAVQRLRVKADAQNKLQTTKEQKVTKTTQNNKQVIVIEPTDPNTIYVPYYNPSVVYGAWPYPAYPPYYWPPAPGYYAGAAIAGGIAFGAGIAVGAWWANNNHWGGGCGWGNNYVNINRNTNVNWNHRPEHRHGVRYNNAAVRNNFAGRDPRQNAANRMDFRGHGGQQVINPGNRPGADRPGADRPGAGDRPGGGDRPGAGAGKDRPGGGDRPGAGAGKDRPGSGGGKAAQRPAQKPGGGAAQRPAARPDTGLSNINHGRNAMAHGDRGRASMGGMPGGGHRGGGGAHVGGGGRGGGGGFHGGGGGRGGGGGGRRSDVRLKHDVMLLGRLDNGLGIYRFAYSDGGRPYVGVMAQEVQSVAPDAVVQDRDGYLRVRYERIGVKFESYDRWVASGGRVPAVAAGR